MNLKFVLNVKLDVVQFAIHGFQVDMSSAKIAMLSLNNNLKIPKDEIIPYKH